MSADRQEPSAAKRQESVGVPIIVEASDGDRCKCGWPDRDCLIRVLGRPPYPEKPCEPGITLDEHYRRQKEREEKLREHSDDFKDLNPDA